MAACAGAPRTPHARATAPTVRTAADGSPARHHQAWRGRLAPPALAGALIPASASTGYAIWGSASLLTTRATLTALGRGGRERLRTPPVQAGGQAVIGRARQTRTAPYAAAAGSSLRVPSPPCAVGAISRLPRKRRHLGEQRRLCAAVPARAAREPPESGGLPGRWMNRSCDRYRHDILLTTRGEQDPLAIRLPALIARERRDPPPGGRSRHFEEYGTCVFAHTVMRRTRRLNMLYPPDEAPAGAPRRSATAARLMASTPMASFREAA